MSRIASRESLSFKSRVSNLKSEISKCRLLPSPGRTSFAIIALVIVLGVSALRADEALPPPGPESWPSFRNGNAQLGVAATKLPDKLELLWTHKSGDKDGMVSSTAAIANARVYAASLNGEVFCLDLKTGKRLWTYRSREKVEPNTFLPGFKAAVAVTADTVYAGDEEGTFHAVDRATGKGRWKFESGGQIVSCAGFYGDKVLFGSHDNSLYCLKQADGSKVWQFVTEGMVNCSPAIVEHFTFITGCDEHLRVIDIDTGKEERDIPLGIYLIASPAVKDNMLYVGTHGAEVLAIDWKQGTRIWAYSDPQSEYPFHSSAAVNDRYVVVGGQDKRVHCIDRQTGKRVWAFATKGKVDSSPVIAGDRVFVGSADRQIYGLKLEDGTEVFRHRDPEGGGFTASPAVGEGCLVIGAESNSGTIFCFGKK
jgi:eukaryotic-like serine/threonine-protein kinase